MTQQMSTDDQVADPFAPARARHIENQLNVGVVRKLLTSLTWQGASQCLSLCIIAGLTWQVMHPTIQNFATTDGRVIPLVASDIPLYSDAQVADFGNQLLRESFTLDFVHYRDQMNAQQGKYSDDGYRSYVAAITNSNVLSALKDKKMNLSIMTSTGVVVSKGQLDNGVYAWKIQYPVVIRLQGQNTSLPAQSFVMSLLISRADQRKKPAGLEGGQLVTFEAPTS